MDRATPSTAFANTLHCALELRKKSWLLAIQFPDREQPSLYDRRGRRHWLSARQIGCDGAADHSD